MISTRKVGVALLTSLLLFVSIETLFFNTDPALQNLNQIFNFPNWQEPLGTDQFGRSNFARLSHAIQTSLLMALFCVFTSALLGVVFGVMAGWRDSYLDHTLNVVVNILLALPGLILVLLFGALLPGSFFMLYVAISLILWVEYFRVVRARVRTLMQSPAIEASRLYGFGPLYLIRRHLWPELKQDVFTLACFGAGNSVLALASIGFVYVGLRPPHAELGLMMVELFPYYSDAPWVLAQPLLVIMVMVLGFHLIAGASNDNQA